MAFQTKITRKERVVIEITIKQTVSKLEQPNTKIKHDPDEYVQECFDCIRGDVETDKYSERLKKLRGKLEQCPNRTDKGDEILKQIRDVMIKYNNI